MVHAGLSRFEVRGSSLNIDLLALRSIASHDVDFVHVFNILLLN